MGRIAILGLVGKVFLERPRIGRWHEDLAGWESKVWRQLRAPANRLRAVHSGSRHPLRNEWLAPDRGSFFQLHALAASAQAKRQPPRVRR